MKFIEQYFPVILFVMLYRVVQSYINLWMKATAIKKKQQKNKTKRKLSTTVVLLELVFR